MARLIIENLSIEQAKELASWYEGQGEQDASVWFEINEIPTPHVDVWRQPWLELDDDTVTIYAA